ncbi:MAG TPA: hypothetical protein VKZ97_05430, partial [Flavobacteriaceae bacterium]|nr:hypothetical protein [Flavobacteriaceae bacterium]
FLIARRFMYWQVYLHKTSLVAEQLLIKVLQRAKELTNSGIALQCSEPLSYFFTNTVTLDSFDDSVLQMFSKLDDVDIVSAMKTWQFHDDFVLSNLCDMIVNRDLLKIKIRDKKVKSSKLFEYKSKLIHKYNITEEEADYFVFTGEISNQAYQQKRQNINILYKTGKVTDISKAPDQLNLRALSKPVTKYYICYPKEKL